MLRQRECSKKSIAEVIGVLQILGFDNSVEDWYDDMIVDYFNQYLKEYSIESNSTWSYKFLENSDIRESQVNKGISLERVSHKLMKHEMFGPVVKGVFSY